MSGSTHAEAVPLWEPAKKTVQATPREGLPQSADPNTSALAICRRRPVDPDSRGEETLEPVAAGNVPGFLPEGGRPIAGGGRGAGFTEHGERGG